MGLFQSTPPVKAATPCGGERTDDAFISIHAAREGGDGKAIAADGKWGKISIHAAREGGDMGRNTFARCAGDFNPRRP